MLKGSFCGRAMSFVRCQHLACGHSGGHVSGSNDLKFGQNVYLDEFDKFLGEFKFGSPGVIRQIVVIPCGHSRGHISCSIDLKIGQNICLYKILDEFDF